MANQVYDCYGNPLNVSEDVKIQRQLTSGVPIAKINEVQLYAPSSGGGGGDGHINYFDLAQFIPDRTYENIQGVLFYEGDTKVDTNTHIVNAAVYPNGDMIACRVGGAVVKITKDGTETTLMTLSNASDWRGVFMDRDLNVYVSPHSSLGGSGLAMTDRGLYRLAYGENTFTKVISLYNPQSSVQTETEENDDTIWTLCQDNKGYLYAGVYAHTKRANPAIYRSTDGGITWTYIVNLVTAGVSPARTSKHIHVICYNEFDDKLYCIVGEVNKIFSSDDNGVTWSDIGTPLEDYKGSAMICVKDGILVGSDGGHELIMSKVYPDGRVKTTGRMWANTVFAIRRSDVTGWLYAFTKIDSSVNNTAYMPPIEALTDPQVLQDWLDSDPANKALWEKTYAYTKDYYFDDCIRPQHCAILLSKDEGETWEIAYKVFTGSTAAYGFITTSYFRNGECVTGLLRKINNSTRFGNPIIISEGKHQFTDDGVDVAGEIFAKTLDSTIINS